MTFKEECQAFLCLGSNIGDRKENLRRAVELLKSEDRLRVVKVSTFYETTPVGNDDQPAFINAVVEVATAHSPKDLLGVCQSIEGRLGRQRSSVRWGPRPLDMDIIIYEDYVCRSKNLTIPHPFFLKRLFVIVPLLEIAPGVVLPNGDALGDLYERGLASGQFASQKIEKAL